MTLDTDQSLEPRWSANGHLGISMLEESIFGIRCTEPFESPFLRRRPLAPLDGARPGPGRKSLRKPLPGLLA